NRLQRPVAVGRSPEITGQDRGIGGLTRWGDFYLFACCRREANAQRKSVHERRRDDSTPRCDCKGIDEVLPGHRWSPSVGSRGRPERSIGSEPQVRQSDCWTWRAIAVSAPAQPGIKRTLSRLVCCGLVRYEMAHWPASTSLACLGTLSAQQEFRFHR